MINAEHNAGREKETTGYVWLKEKKKKTLHRKWKEMQSWKIQFLFLSKREEQRETDGMFWCKISITLYFISMSSSSVSSTGFYNSVLPPLLPPASRREKKKITKIITWAKNLHFAS